MQAQNGTVYLTTGETKPFDTQQDKLISSNRHQLGNIYSELSVTAGGTSAVNGGKNHEIVQTSIETQKLP